MFRFERVDYIIKTLTYVQKWHFSRNPGHNTVFYLVNSVVAKEDCKLTESHIDSSKGHSKQVSPELVSSINWREAALLINMAALVNMLKSPVRSNTSIIDYCHSRKLSYNTLLYIM